MRPGALLVLLLTAAPAFAGSSIAQLAARMADEIAGVAGGRAVEIVAPEDRTGRGPALVLDLAALVSARLAGRVTLRDSGERLRIVSVLSESGGRLVLSARVVAEPEGRLVDLLSTSVEQAGDLLAPSPERSPSGSRVVEVVSATRTPALEEAVVDLAFVDDERLAVLAPTSLSLYHLESSGLVRQARQAFPGASGATRISAGLLVVTRESSLWALTNRSQALLFGTERGRLQARAEAKALPWHGSGDGLRYRPGTNLLEGGPASLGQGPLLAICTGPPEAGVASDGELRLASACGPKHGPRVGSSLTSLWGGLLAASSTAPPGSADAVLILGDDGSGRIVVDRLGVDGAIRGLAARVRGETARLVAAVEETPSSTYLMMMDLRQREP